MALTENDLVLIKLYGISQAEFEKADAKAQNKMLQEGLKNYAKSRELQGKQEYFENAQKAIPEIKKQFEKPPTVYYRKKSIVKGKATTSILECQIVGYSPKDNKFLTVNPNSEAEVPNIVKVLESDIMTSPEK
jgi:predicted Holliday junction resolvase-like endonuclease